MKCQKLSYKQWGLPCYEVDGEVYCVGSEDLCRHAAYKYCKDTLWAFNTSFIARFVDLNDKQIVAVKKMQEELCEDANPIIEKLLGKKLNQAIIQAVEEDGFANYLASYDGVEYSSNDIPGLPPNKLAFRIE